MDNSIILKVYDSLEKRTDEIRKLADERNKLDDKISSGRYSQETLTKDVRPKRDEIHKQILSASEDALNEAQKLIDEYRTAIAERKNLKPEEITDDIKLLQPGIVLLPRDVQGMLSRNENNSTMTQIILRYAEEHDIDTRGMIYNRNNGQEEERIAQALEAILRYYRKWSDKPNAKEMLPKFFKI